MRKTFGECPVCGEMHHLPETRSMNPFQMGCSEVLGDDAYMFNHERCMHCGEYTDECMCAGSLLS